jgi:hypothetical protein
VLLQALKSHDCVLLQVNSLWLGNNDIGLHGLLMLADFLASVRVSVVLRCCTHSLLQPVRVCHECRSHEIKLQAATSPSFTLLPSSISLILSADAWLEHDA